MGGSETQLRKNRRRRWSRLETLAWVIYRRLEAVQLASELENSRPEQSKSKTDPLTRLVITVARRQTFLDEGGPYDAGTEVDRAGQELQRSEADGSLQADRNGRFVAEAVRQLFPSDEGRGKGLKTKTDGAREKIIKLGSFFLTTPPEWEWSQQAFEFCREQKIIANRTRYKPLRDKALAWAEKELNARERMQIGIEKADVPSDEEFAKTRVILNQWKELAARRRR